ncbi:MAG: hydrogenase iron-sulfur subunit [Candidatus Bathyarchaeia archaeon]
MSAKIVCFMCNWAFCLEEMEIPKNVNVARVMCIGRLDPAIVLDVLANGADGVLMVGCKPPDCHYIEGNLHAERAVKLLKKLVALAGLEPERVKLEWYTPLEGESFIQHLKEFNTVITGLGESPIKASPESELMLNILAAKNAASDFRLRVLLGREKELTESINVYGEKISQEEFDFLMDEIVKEDFLRHKIHLLTKTKPLSVKDLAKALGIKPADVLKQIVNMRRKNMITIERFVKTTPLYKALEVK